MPTSISGIEAEAPRVYYDAASGCVRVKSVAGSKGQVILSDMAGRRLQVVPFSADGNGLDMHIPTSGLSKGVYFVTLEEGTKRETWKITN